MLLQSILHQGEVMWCFLILLVQALQLIGYVEVCMVPPSPGVELASKLLIKVLLLLQSRVELGATSSLKSSVQPIPPAATKHRQSRMLQNLKIH
ncbi:hypothetical protein SLEP1_g39036 [Rubroshorea leprosula]|uniref:Secreted protein n=1 Tax=Rubroshorea leprosula TaxID=152421 RepID=A0AAV5L014_9ROSI|nr:hypothetical protein SLEP1_g39036 [Rubroshorea leprosula]